MIGTGVLVSLKIIKNCELATVDGDAVKQAISDNKFWCNYEGELKRSDSVIESKYGDFNCFEVHEKRAGEKLYERLCNIVPCAGTASIELDGKLLAFANLKYESVQIEKPAPTILTPGGPAMVQLSTQPSMDKEKLTKTLDPLPRCIWKQMRAKDGSVRFLIQMGFDGPSDPSFDPVVRKDDVTGLAYPYRILRLLVLVQKTPPTAPANSPPSTTKTPN